MYRRWLWAGLVGVVLSIIVLSYATGLGSLMLHECNNDFSVRASNLRCSFPSLVSYAGIALLFSSVIAMLAGLMPR